MNTCLRMFVQTHVNKSVGHVQPESFSVITGYHTLKNGTNYKPKVLGGNWVHDRFSMTYFLSAKQCQMGKYPACLNNGYLIVFDYILFFSHSLSNREIIS